MNLEVSLIIPSHNPGANLNILLKSILGWTSYPSEILVIDSSSEEPYISQEFKEFLIKEKISFQIICRSHLYPGKARNIGIKESVYDAIAFLDIMTIPESNWLENNFFILCDSNIDGIWGSTSYTASTKFDKIVRACTFGDLPIKTLPGSIIKRLVLESAGLFIESTRAGEDADWMSRVSLHNFKFQNSAIHLRYMGLSHLTFRHIIAKWYRNYFFGAKLPYLSAHKDVYFYFASLFLIIAAFNWNTLSYDPLISGWNTNSLAYIPNVTKISILLLASFYVIFRGFYSPIKKGVKIGYIILNLPAIIFVSMILDSVKSFAFLSARVFSRKAMTK